MLETIEKLLILQDRDQKIRRQQGELAHIEPERQSLKIKAATAQAELEDAKLRIRQIESARKDLELEVETKKAMIVRYANQQFQTRKNEEYRALAHEIETCKEAIFKIENQEIELMEQGEAAQKEVLRATQAVKDTARSWTSKSRNWTRGSRICRRNWPSWKPTARTWRRPWTKARATATSG